MRVKFQLCKGMQAADLVIRVHRGVMKERKDLVEENSFLTPCLSTYNSPVQKRFSVKGGESREGERKHYHFAPGNRVIWDLLMAS